jgi:hypothetical protein
MRTFLSADQNSYLTIEDRIIYGLAASHSSACAAHGATAVRPACDAAKQIGISLRAVAPKMRMPILRHLCADAPPAQNREWKERSSGRAHNSRALTARFVRGCSENARNGAATVRERLYLARCRSLTFAAARTSDIHRSLTVAAPFQWGTHHFHRLGVNGPPAMESGLLSCPAPCPAMLHRSRKTPAGPLRPFE